MLILARKVGQKIIIAGEIEITVVEVRGEHVRLGINAPRSISVHREELLQHILQEGVEPGKCSLPQSGELDALTKTNNLE